MLGHLWLPASVPGAASTPPRGAVEGSLQPQGALHPNGRWGGTPQEGPLTLGQVSTLTC